MSVKITDFEKLKEDYDDCLNFEKVMSSLRQRPSREISEYTFQGGYLFKNNKLCIPRTSVRDFLVWELHAGGLSDHFSRTKTIEAVDINFIGQV